VKNNTDGGSITLKWKLLYFDNPYGYTVQLYYNEEDERNRIAQEFVRSPKSKPVDVSSKITIKDVPFKGRVEGFIEVNADGNGRCSLTISNLQFDDSGVIILKAFPAVGKSNVIREKITYSVEGELSK